MTGLNQTVAVWVEVHSRQRGLPGSWGSEYFCNMSTQDAALVGLVGEVIESLVQTRQARRDRVAGSGRRVEGLRR